MTISLGMAASPISRHLVRRKGRAIPVLCSVVILSALFLACFGHLLAPHDPTLPNQAWAHVGATPGHPLGFDSQGRDILSRLLAGANTSIFAPTVITVLAVVTGTTLGISAAWFGGRIDTLISSAVDLLFSFPGMLLAILAAAVFGRGPVAPVIALAIAYTPLLARIVRSAALRERAKDYIVAAELQGLSGLTVCLRHLIPNIAPVIVAQATLVFGYSIADFAAVSYLGLGVQPPAADWGIMTSEGQLGLLLGYPMESLSAAFMIVLVVVAVNVLGEWLLERKEGIR